MSKKKSSKIKPDGEFVLNSFDTKVNIEPWKHTKLVASILVVDIFI
jgi:SSS family solute:Na+ symporter